MSNWANILPELLILILQKLPVVDFLAARIVCVRWRRAAATTYPKPDAPWLMLPGDTDSTAKFFSLSSRRVLSTRISNPPIRSRIVIGSDYGWIITVDEQCEMQLLNPVSGVQVPLPPITSLPSVEAVPESTHYCTDKQFRFSGIAQILTCDLMRRLFFQSAILAPAPQPDNYTVMLIAKCTRTIVAFARNGDEVWESPIMPNLGHITDTMHAIFHKGCFYTMAQRGAIVAWEPCGRSFVPRVIEVVLPQIEADFWKSSYLVESLAGNLMLMLLQFAPYDDPCPIGSIEVLVLDEKESKWVQEKDIGTAAMFININRALCFSTEEYPELKANCVYFAIHHLPWTLLIQRREPVKTGVYDLKSRRVSRIKKLAGVAHQNWPPPAWLSPSLR